MIRPILKHLHSPDLNEPALPPDPGNCTVFIQAMIGPDDEIGEESFGLEVVTATYLREHDRPQSGRGVLVLDSFDWRAVRSFIEERLSKAARESWSEIGEELNKELHWEFDNYKPHISRGAG